MRIGLIGASVRSAATDLAPTSWLSIAIDQFSDQETAEVLGSRSLIARDWKHARGLVMQFSRSPRIRKRKSNLGYLWLTTGGLDLQPQLLETLSWSGSHLLGCQLEAIGLAKSIEKWTTQIREFHPYVPRLQPRQCLAGRWFRKQNWPLAPAPFHWQEAVAGELRSALFLASSGKVRLIGRSRLHHTSEEPDLAKSVGPWVYAGNEFLEYSKAPQQELSSLEQLGSWFAGQPGVHGLFGIDYIWDGQVWPIEINPRPTASVEVYQAVLQRNLWKEHVIATVASLAAADEEWAQQLQEQLAEAPVAADDISSAKTTESSTFETTSAISNVPEVKGGSTKTTGTPFDGTGKTSCKRIVYNRGAQWNVDAKYWENCLQQLEQFGQEQGIVTELVDRPRTGTVVPAGAPAFTLLLNSKPEQPVSDLWLLGQRLDHLLTAEFVGQRNIETLEV